MPAKAQRRKGIYSLRLCAFARINILKSYNAR
jgi:hypothetical protein